MSMETIRDDYRKLLSIVTKANAANDSIKPSSIPFFAANRAEGEDSVDAAFRIYANYGMWLMSILKEQAPCTGQKLVELMAKLIRELFYFPKYDIELNKRLSKLFEKSPFDPSKKSSRKEFQTILEEFSAFLET